MRQASRVALTLALLPLIFGSAPLAAAPLPEEEAIVEVTVSGVEQAPTLLPATDFLVTVEHLFEGSIPGTSLVVRVPGRDRTLRAGERALLSLTPAADGSFRLLRVGSPEARENRAAPLRAEGITALSRVQGMGDAVLTGQPVELRATFAGPGRSAQWEIFPGALLASDAPCAPATFCALHVFSRPGAYQVRVRVTGERGQTSEATRTLLVQDAGAASAGEKIVAGLFEGNGFVSSLGVFNPDGIHGRVTLTLKDAEGASVGRPALLPLGGPRALLFQPLSGLFPQVVGRRGPFSVHFVSDGVPFTASANLLEIETGDRIFLPAAAFQAGDIETGAGEMFLPRVVRSQGAGLLRTTQLAAYNPATGSDQGRLLTLELWERGQDNTAPRTSYRFVDPGRTVLIGDILLDLFGLEEGIGALRVSWSGAEGPAPHLVGLTSTSPDTGDGMLGKRFGALIDTLTEAQAIRTHGADTGALQTSSAHSSFGVVNLAPVSTTLRLILKDAAGRVLATTLVGLRPRQHLERNVAGLFQRRDTGRSWTVETDIVSGGPVLTYLAHMDANGDLSFVPGQAL